MITDSPTYRALSNALYSMISFGWPIILAIFVTPFVVNSLGVKEYGVYLFISTLISLAGLLDIGIASALSKFIAEEHGKSNTSELAKIFRIGNSIFFIIACIGSLGIISTIFVGEYFFGAKVTEYLKYSPSFIAGGFMFFINSLMSLYLILPSSIQRVDAGVKVGLSFFTIQQIVIIGSIMCDIGVNGIFISLTVTYALFYFLYRRMASNLVTPELRSALHGYGWNKGAVLKYYAFGIKVFVNNIASSSLTYLDKVIMPLFIGPSNLTYYGIAGSVANKTPAVSNTFANVIFPMTASFEGAGDRERTKILYTRSMRLITILSVAITVTILSFPYKILQYWINEDVALHATETLIILTWTNLFLALSGPLTNFLIGMGRMRALTLASLFAAGLNALLLFILLPLAGLTGAAWAYLLALIPYIFLFVWTENTLLQLSGRIRFYTGFILKLTITSVLLYLFNIYVLAGYIHDLPTVLVTAGISVCLFIGAYRVLGFFEKEDVTDLSAFGKTALYSLRSRIKGA